MKVPINELEQAFTKALPGSQGYPDFLRHLRAAPVLVALVPYHPEMVDTGEVLSNQGMKFKLISDKRGPAIPIYTCVDRTRKLSRVRRLY